MFSFVELFRFIICSKYGFSSPLYESYIIGNKVLLESTKSYKSLKLSNGSFSFALCISLNTALVASYT